MKKKLLLFDKLLNLLRTGSLASLRQRQPKQQLALMSNISFVY